MGIGYGIINFIHNEGIEMKLQLKADLGLLLVTFFGVHPSHLQLDLMA